MAEVEIKPENMVYAKPRLITDEVMHYCPGCSHGTVHKLVAEVIDEMGLEKSTIAVSPVGCSVFAYKYVDVDWVEAAHGRACAVASAIKRLHPDKLVFSYQGDGDLAAIGTAETIHAAARGENIATIFINNAIYGMTGGQMSPTTLLGQKTATTPYGRDSRLNGFPYKIAEMLVHLDGATYITRQSPQMQEGHTARVRKLARGKRLLDGRGGGDVQQRLENVARGFQQVARREHAAPLPVGRHKVLGVARITSKAKRNERDVDNSRIRRSGSVVDG